jgi:4-amino-4-deoxy-L-arabinose transferase-like glycosyltransferase
LPHKISRREWMAVLVVLLLAFALRTIDLTRVPPGLHNDEVADALITRSVVGGRLAIFFPENIGNEGLYYYFAAPFMKFIGSSVFALRLPPAFLSLIAACVIWAFSRRLFGPIAAFTALIGFSIVFWPVEFGRILLHVVMEVPLAALAAYLFWRARETSQRRGLLLSALSGLCVGLAIDAYTAARVLPIIFVVFGLYVLIARRAHWREWWARIVIGLAAAAIAVLPLAIFLIQNPQDDQLGFFEIDRPLTELRQGNLQPVIETSLNTLGMFAFVGDPLPYYDLPGRPILEPIGALLLLLGLLIALWRWRKPEYAFLLIWFFGSLAPGLLSQPAPNYTRTLGVQVVMFSLIGLAVAAIVTRWRSKIVYAGLAIVAAGNLIWTVHDYFTVWPSIDVVRFWHQAGLNAVADRLQVDPDSSPAAICVPEYLIDESQPWWYPAWKHMQVLLQRDDLSLRYYNCLDAIVLIDGPARYAFPDAADAAAIERFPIYSQFLLAAPIDWQQLPDRLGFILRATRADMSLDDQLTRIGSQSKVQWAPEAGGGSAPLPIDLGDRVELLGYTLLATSSQRAGVYDLATYWRVTGELPPRLSQFTHLLNAQGAIITQEDRLDLTSASLRPGDVFVQMHHLTLPTDLKSGTYDLSIGLYTQVDGKRLPVMLNGQPHGDRLFLRSIEVVK